MPVRCDAGCDCDWSSEYIYFLFLAHLLTFSQAIKAPKSSFCCFEALLVSIDHPVALLLGGVELDNRFCALSLAWFLAVLTFVK